MTVVLFQFVKLYRVELRACVGKGLFMFMLIKCIGEICTGTVKMLITRVQVYIIGMDGCKVCQCLK